MITKYKTSDYFIDNSHGDDMLVLYNNKSGKYDIELDFKRKEIRIVKYGTFDSNSKQSESGWKLINDTKMKLVKE